LRNKMIKIATPISGLFNDADLVNKLIQASDCLECRPESGLKKYSKEYLFHFDFSPIHEWSREIKEYLKKTILPKEELRLITFHLASSCSDPKLVGGIFQPGGKNYSKEQLLQNAAENFAWLRSIFENKILIAVENNNYYPTEAYKYVTEGDFISQVVHDNNINFLFDLAHAKITAHNKKISYKDYLSGLPIEKTIQIHICKHGIDKNSLAFDAHELPDEIILKETAEIIKRYPVEYLTVEYYREAEGLLGVLSQCRKLSGVLVNA